MGDLQSSDFQRYQVTLAALGKINPTTKILAIRFKRQGMAFHMRLVTCEDHTQTKAFGEQPPAARAATLASALSCGKGTIAGKVHKGGSVPRAAILTSMRRSGPFFAPEPAQATVTRADPPTSPQARRSSSTMTQAAPQHVAFAAEEPDAAELTSAPRAHRSPAKGFTTENPAALTSAPHQASQVHTPKFTPQSSHPKPCSHPPIASVYPRSRSPVSGPARKSGCFLFAPARHWPAAALNITSPLSKRRTLCQRQFQRRADRQVIRRLARKRTVMRA